MNLKTRLLFILLGLLSPAYPLLAEPSTFFDWVNPGDHNYVVLQQAAGQSGLDNWMTQRLKQNRPLPQASARDLVNDLCQSESVSAPLKQELKDAFPSEAEEYHKNRVDMTQELARLKARIDALEPRINEILESKDRNNLSALSTPQGSLTFTSFFWDTDYHLLVHHQDAYLSPSLFGNNLTVYLHGVVGAATWNFTLCAFTAPYETGAVLSSPAYQNTFSPFPPNYYYGQQPYVPGVLGPQWSTFNSFDYVGIPNAYITFHFDPALFRNIDVTYGVFYFPPVDNLIYSPMAITTNQPFFSGNVIQTSEAEPMTQATFAFYGLDIQKAGQSGWWMFTNSSLYLEPAKFNGDNDLAMARLDLRAMDLWLIEDSNIYVVSLLSETPKYFSTKTIANTPLYQSNHDYSVNVKGQLPGGGLITGEWATANWYSAGPQPVPSGTSAVLIPQSLAWQDTAESLDMSKSFGDFSFLVQASKIGPYYMVGRKGSTGLWTDIQQSNHSNQNTAIWGNFEDNTVWDPRPGNTKKITWQTIDNGFDGNDSNTQRINFQTTWSNFFTVLGLSAGYETQINPSGPWITTSNWLNNRPENGYDWYKIIGAQYAAVAPGTTSNNIIMTNALAQYNLATYANAYYRNTKNPVTMDFWGQPASGKWNWLDLQSLGYQTTVQTLTLSQHGVGDFVLRDDSIKTINDMRFTLKLDLRALFHYDNTFLIQGYTDLRDIDESIHPARYTANDLLCQILNEYFLTYGLNETVNLLGYVGYENWLSNASAFPVNTIDDSFGVGADFMLNKVLTGLTVGARYKFMDHKDLDFPIRDFFGFVFNIGTTVTY